MGRRFHAGTVKGRGDTPAPRSCQQVVAGAGPSLPRYGYVMAQKTDEAGDGANSRPKQRGAASAALAGALIGALAGLTGSTLAYFEAKDTHRSEADARRADIRRAAYVELAASTNRYVQQATQLLRVSLDPATSAQDRQRRFEDSYAPANTDLARAYTTVRLVTTDEGRRDLERIGALSTRVGEMATDRLARGPEGVDVKKTGVEFTEAVERQLAALQTFMDRAAHEAL
ncbi:MULTISPECIES: hypothetical protein [unclassified Streptomyces]|uniref:hypothetical protein n=1 Tax=unclassified Streptomyces TaxID=2593676 RepID=UPI002E123445|nr:MULTISPECIES: hypothetical protein [unclassified Streptomyces]WSR24168.1 hypothetical protein OG573_37270 [Streptomyces sp. NBC_01205]